MKMKKMLAMFTLLPLLMGCNGDPYVGKYLFQMGKTKDTHIGASLELKSELYDSADESKGKKFDFSIDVKSEALEDMSELLGDISSLSGSYSVDNERQVYGASMLIMNIYIIEEYSIPTELTNLLFVANITSSAVTFYIPVSFNDLSLQLYWYGYDLSSLMNDDGTPKEGGDEDDFIPPSPHGEHEIGTHPTKEDIDKINETYPSSHDGTKFRDYHILKLGLIKQ